MKVNAERRRHTSSEQRQMERQAKRNERYDQKPVEITQQPKKTRSRYVGYVTFEWINGPNKGKKHNTQITLRNQARLKIRGRDLVIMPKDGDEYVWGEKDPNPNPTEEAMTDYKRRVGNPPGKREARLRDIVQAKFEEFLEERGPHGAGKAMATCFVRAHNKLEKRIAKLALAKIYNSVLRTHRAAFLAFSRAVRNSAALKNRVQVDERDEAMKKVRASLIQAARGF